MSQSSLCRKHSLRCISYSLLKFTEYEWFNSMVAAILLNFPFWLVVYNNMIGLFFHFFI